MPLTKEQIAELKRQLSEQIQHLPEEQREAAQQQIDSMSDEAIETMLLEQQARQSSASPNTTEIYRAIVSGQIPSKKLDENQNAIAVLDIKPISRGHTIIIPKTPVTDSKALPAQAFSLAKKIAKKISSKLKSKSCEIQTQFAFGEAIINVIPIYDKPLSINSPRMEAKPEDLEELHALLKTIKKAKVIKIKKQKSGQKNIIKLKRRVP